MSKERTYKRQVTPYTKSRVGSPPIKVHNLAKKDFEKKPSEAFDGKQNRDHVMAAAVVGDAAPEFDPGRSIQEQEKSAAESRMLPISAADAYISELRTKDLPAQLSAGKLPDLNQLGSDIEKDIKTKFLESKRGQALQRAQVPVQAMQDLYQRYLGSKSAKG